MTIAASVVILKVRYSLGELLGAFVVLVGVTIALIPTLEGKHGGSSSSANSSDAFSCILYVGSTASCDDCVTCILLFARFDWLCAGLLCCPDCHFVRCQRTLVPKRAKFECVRSEFLWQFLSVLDIHSVTALVWYVL